MDPISRPSTSVIPSGQGPRSGLDPPWAPPPGEDDLYLKLRAYLECRAHDVPPPPELAAAWDHFYHLYTPWIRAWLGRFHLSEADREDCLQDVWSKVITCPAVLRNGPRRDRVWAWLMTVTRNQAIDALRRRRRYSFPWDDGVLDIADENPGPADAHDRIVAQAQVRSALTELSERSPTISFQVLHLRTIEGKSCAEVADRLGLTPEQVRSRLHRMMRRFRNLLARSWPLDQIDEQPRQPRSTKKFEVSGNAASPRSSC